MSRPFRPAATPLTPEQLELRKLVYKQASNHPGTFAMGWWEVHYTADGKTTWPNTPREEVCNTTRCIAGWAQFLARGKVSEHNVEYDAIRLLGISRAEWRMTGGTCEEHAGADVTGLFYATDTEALEALRKLAGE